MLNPNEILPIGIGTWGIGGFVEKNPENNDKKQIEAISYSLSKGQNFAEVCNWYAEGRAVRLFKDSLDNSGKKLKDIFLSLSLYQHRNPTLRDVEIEFEEMQKLFNTEKFDAILVTFSGLKVWGIEDTINMLHTYLDKNFTRFISITNSNLEMVKRFKKEFGKNFFAHELMYNFELRENKDYGIVDYAIKNGIKNVVWQPLRRKNTSNRNWEMLLNLSKKYSCTQNQIILSWLVTEGFIPLVKSENKEHINDNIDSLKIKLSYEDIKKLNVFRPSNWNTPKIDWDKVGDGVSVAQLPTIFDEEYDKQNNQ